MNRITCSSCHRELRSTTRPERVRVLAGGPCRTCVWKDREAKRIARREADPGWEAAQDFIRRSKAFQLTLREIADPLVIAKFSPEAAAYTRALLENLSEKLQRLDWKLTPYDPGAALIVQPEVTVRLP